MRLLRFKLWHLMVTIAAFPLWAPILAIVIFIASAPYGSWYLDSCLRRSEEASLVGRPEADVARVLGPPTYVRDHDDPSVRERTYVYEPGLGSSSLFEVNCRNGIVKGYWIDD
jgi:hypothetical protein